MKFYTVDDLENILDIYPCSTETGYISYSKGYLIDIIKQDFDKERLFLKRNIWNNEEPAVYGLNDTTPYSEEAKAFAKSHKTHGGGRNLIVMNEAYFSNARYAIENRYWDSQQDTFKKDTRAAIRNAVSNPVMTQNEAELRHVVEELLNAFLSKVNKEIASINDFLKSKYSQFYYYHTFYMASYVQRQIGSPAELLTMLDNQLKVMRNGIQSLSINDEKQEKFIDNIVSLLAEKNYPDTDKINTIVDRIYDREKHLIQQLREKYEKFGKIKTEIYILEEEIKMETEERIRTCEKIYPDSLIIQHAKDNGLLSISFRLPDK